MDPVPLDMDRPLWEQVFLVAPLVLVGTLEEDGSPDLAPKHMAMPLSWERHYGFVCAPGHATARNVRREGAFTVSYPRPGQELMASLAAAPREGDGSKPSVGAIPTVTARHVRGVLVAGCAVWLECELDRVVADLGPNLLVVGRVVAASAAPDAVRAWDVDDADLVHEAPLLAYIHPGRVAAVRDTVSFPYHQGFSR